MISIAKILRPADRVEIIIVDNGSVDDTLVAYHQIAETFSQLDWHYFYDDTPGLLTGRHRGAREAKGDVLAYLDDDIVLAPTWLEALEEAFRDRKAVLVGGPSRPLFETTPPCWLQEFWTDIEGGRQCGWLSLIECGDVIKPVDPSYIWGLNFCITKEVFKQCGGFHPDCLPNSLQRYQGDGETGLANKIRDAGFTCLYHPGLAVQHVIPRTRLTPASFEQRAFYQGVCDSFTEIRRERRVPIMPWCSWKDALRLTRWTREYISNLRGSSASAMRSSTAGAYLAGMRFHRSEVRNDRRLLDWVLKQNYFDYRLPEGWRSYLNGSRLA
jgi:glycosyltransferase involved in cell wall biosynthesis